jgi:hypothetical protein
VISTIRLEPQGYHSAAPAVLGLVVVALVVVLTGAELCRAYGSPGAEGWRRRLQAAAVPLLLCSIVLVAARLAPIVR